MPDSVTPRPFWNDGGPLMVVPQAVVPCWEGTDPPSAGRVVAAAFRWGAPDAPATDYDRACDGAAERALVLDVGPAWAVVLGTAAAQSAHWLLGPGPGEVCVVGIEAVVDGSAGRLLRLAAAQPSAAWRVLREAAAVGAEGVLLAHAASRLTEVRELTAFAAPGEGEDPEPALIGDGLRCPLPAGSYRISTADVASHADEFLTFVRFTPLAAAP